MQNWSLKVKWTQPKLGNLLWAGNMSGNWQSSYRTHIHAHQFNAIKACTFLKCWGRICRIDLWRWNEHNRSLATYCELETCRVIDNLPIAYSFWRTPIQWDQSLYVSEVLRQDMLNWSLEVKWTQPKPGNLLWARNVSGNWQSSNRAQLDAYQLNEIKACTFLKCWGRICRIDLWRWNEDNRSLATYCELETCRVIDNLPIALSLTHTNWMRSKPVCFWSVEAGYAELIFKGEMNSTEAW